MRHCMQLSNSKRDDNTPGHSDIVVTIRTCMLTHTERERERERDREREREREKEREIERER